MIVDSYLGNLKSFNSRTNPIFEDFYLPQKYQLIYASSDTGKDLFTNFTLKQADKASTKCLKSLIDGNIPMNPKRVRSSFYSGIRYLVNTL